MELKEAKNILTKLKNDMELRSSGWHSRLDPQERNAIETVMDTNKRLEKELYDAEEKVGELFGALFLVVRNKQVMPAGLQLGKTQEEITRMTVEVVDKIIEKTDYEIVKKLLGEASGN